MQPLSEWESSNGLLLSSRTFTFHFEMLNAVIYNYRCFVCFWFRFWLLSILFYRIFLRTFFAFYIRIYSILGTWLHLDVWWSWAQCELSFISGVLCVIQVVVVSSSPHTPSLRTLWISHILNACLPYIDPPTLRIVGTFFGVYAVCGMLTGNLVVSVQLAISMR